MHIDQYGSDSQVLDAVRDRLWTRLRELLSEIDELETRFNGEGIWAPFSARRYERELQPLTEEVDEIRRKISEVEEQDRREQDRREQAQKRERLAEELVKVRAEMERKEQMSKLRLKEVELDRKYMQDKVDFFLQQTGKQAPSASAARAEPVVLSAGLPVAETMDGGEPRREKAPALSSAPPVVASPDRSVRSSPRAGAEPIRPPTPSPVKAVSSSSPVKVVSSGSAPTRTGTTEVGEEMTGEQLIAWRKGRGMTQGALAALLNTTQGNISKAESKLNALISADWVKRLSRS